MLAVLGAVLRYAAREWRWLDRVPVFPKLKVPAKRVRWLKPDEAEKLLRELPQHKRDLSEFSLETGLRADNAARLRWSQVDLERRCAWVDADETKSEHAIGIPLSNRAVEIIKAQLGKHPEFVFTYTHGKKGVPRPIRGGMSTAAWYKALRSAGIKNFRWHDQRHTWASWHIQKGTPTAVLQALGKWSDIRMVEKYAHLNTEHLREYVDKSTKSAQSAH